VNCNDYEDTVMTDEGAQFDGDSYRITHTAEKFSLRPMQDSNE